MNSWMRHRHALAVPFVVLLLVTLVGGLVFNDLDARGVVRDDLTDEPVPGTTLAHGTREVMTDEDGEFTFPNVPRTSLFQVRPPSGYQHERVPTTTEEIRLDPLSVTIYVSDETKTPEDRVQLPQARDPENTRILGNGNASGQIIVAPHPGRDARLLICAEGFEPKEITVEGVLMEIVLAPGGTGCPPLPTPTPDPDATPTPEPSPEVSPEASPEPSPASTPSPTATP